MRLGLKLSGLGSCRVPCTPDSPNPWNRRVEAILLLIRKREKISLPQVHDVDVRLSAVPDRYKCRDRIWLADMQGLAKLGLQATI